MKWGASRRIAATSEASPDVANQPASWAGKPAGAHMHVLLALQMAKVRIAPQHCDARIKISARPFVVHQQVGLRWSPLEGHDPHNLELASFHQASLATRHVQSRLPSCRPALRGGWSIPCAANSAQQETAAPQRQSDSGPPASSETDDVFDLVATARRKTANSSTQAAPAAPPQPGLLSSFFAKCAAAYRIFFPPGQRNLSPKELGRNRLRMILVADRCSMNPSSLSDMK